MCSLQQTCLSILGICQPLLKAPVGLIPPITSLSSCQLPLGSLHSCPCLFTGCLALVPACLSCSQAYLHAFLCQLLNGRLNLHNRGHSFLVLFMTLHWEVDSNEYIQRRLVQVTQL